MKNTIGILFLIFLVTSCSLYKNNEQGTYDIINIVLSDKIDEKKDSINLFVVIDTKNSELYKMLYDEKHKTDRLFKNFLSHHNIPINFDEEKDYFKNQIIEPLSLDLDKIKPKKLSIYDFPINQVEKSKYSNPEFGKNSFYLVRPVFTKDKKYAIMYQRINDHIFYFQVFHKKNSVWQKFKTYNSSRIIIDGKEIDLF